MTASPTSVWPLSVLALLQVLFGMALVPGTDELDGSWTIGPLVVAVGLAGAFSWLWATGPLSIGVWHWDSLVLGAFAAYLVVVLVRELRRLPAGRPAASGRA